MRAHKGDHRAPEGVSTGARKCEIWFLVRQRLSFSVELSHYVDHQYCVPARRVEGTVPEFAKLLAVGGRHRLSSVRGPSAQQDCSPRDEVTPMTLRSEGFAVDGTSEPIRVLICDDESRLVALTAGLLRDFGYQVLTVRTGESAIECASSQTIDVVILDINLPGEDTLEVARRLLEVQPLAIVLSSGFAEEDVEPELLTLPGVHAFLAKPYRIELLSATIRQAAITNPRRVPGRVAADGASVIET